MHYIYIYIYIYIYVCMHNIYIYIYIYIYDVVKSKRRHWLAVTLSYIYIFIAWKPLLVHVKESTRKVVLYYLRTNCLTSL